MTEQYIRNDISAISSSSCSTLLATLSVLRKTRLMMMQPAKNMVIIMIVLMLHNG